MNAILSLFLLLQVIPPGHEREFLQLLGPYGAGVPLPQGWLLVDTRIGQDSVTYHFHRGDDRILLVLEAVVPAHAVRTRHFGVRLLDPGGCLGRKEHENLLGYLGGLVRKNDTAGWEPFRGLPKKPAQKPPASRPSAQETLPSACGDDVMWSGSMEVQYESALPVPPTLALQAWILLAVVFLTMRGKALLDLARRVPRNDWLWLGGFVAVGLVLRLLGGVKIPGFINCHGYEQVNEILHNPPYGYNFHGNSLYALHGLALLFLPRSEFSVVTVHFLLSIGLVPAVYALGRLWLGDRQASLWAACIAAVLPVSVFYAASEVRLVPGALFLVATLVTLGVAARDRHPLPLLAAALLGAVTIQFQPFLLLTPLAALLFLLSTPKGRGLLRLKWTWIAALLFALLWLEPAWLALSHLCAKEEPTAQVFFPFSRAYLLVLPATDAFLRHAGNVFINTYYTPAPLGLLVFLGLLAVIASRLDKVSRAAFFCILATALLFTLPGMIQARMNPARLQLAAQPFYCLLAGWSLAWLLRRIRSGVLRRFAGMALLGSMLLVWPGPIGATFTPQMERRVIKAGIDHLGNNQMVVWPAQLKESTLLVSLPIYLSGERGRVLLWGGLLADQIPECLRRQGQLVYYRPAHCYDMERHSGGPVPDQNGDKLRGECARVESQLVLQPLFLRSIAAKPDYFQEYSQERLRVGFFKVLAVNDAP